MRLLKLIFTVSILCTALIASAQEDSTKLWTIKGENTLLLNQSSFTNWASGGVNAFAANLSLNYDFNYKNGKWSWDNKVIAAYGQTFQKETDWRKNDDRFMINSLLGYEASEKWFYTFFMNFNTQFANGYDYSGDERKFISAAFAPAYLSFGPGFAFKESDNFKVNVSPAAARMIFVNDQVLADAGQFGVDPGKKSRFEFGASLDAYYKVNIMENIAFENMLKLYSNYLEDPQNIDVDYTANLFMTVNRFITVNAGVQLIYDDNTMLTKKDERVGPGIQVKQILGAGVTYKF